MGGLFKKTTISTSEPRIGALNVQTSAYGMVIPIVFGRTRLPVNLIWYGDFTPIAHTTTQSSGGKGGGVTQQNTSYTYQTALAMGICEGEIGGVTSVWKGKQQFSDGEVDDQEVTVNNEQHVIPVELEITVANAAEFVADLGVLDLEWNPLIDVSPAAPAAPNEYSRVDGTYTFDASREGDLLQVSYTYLIPGHPITALEQAGLELFTGTTPQSPWGYLETHHPSEALGYQGLAYLAAGAYDLGSSPELPNHNVEVDALLPIGGGIVDADPSVVLTAYLASEQFGAGFPAEKIGDLGSFSDYCVASGFFVSPAWLEQAAANEQLNELLDAVNCAAVYSEGLLKIVPYGDAAVTGHSVTWIPDLTPVYDLTNDDYLDEEEPVRVRRSTPADAFNQLQVEFLNRANQYNIQIAEAKDQANIETFGLRTADPVRFHLLCDQDIAQKVAQTKLQRLLYVRNTYEFTLGWNFSRLEPMDVVTLTETNLGLDRFPVRLTSVKENEDGDIAIEAEELTIGVASAPLYPSQSAGGASAGWDAEPGSVNAPLIFEPPLALTGGPLELWAAVSGGDDWGGCSVWASFDGQTYQRIGTVAGPARYDVLHADVDAPLAEPDTDSTVIADLNTDGQLLSGTQADVDAYATLCYVGGELVAYKNATLTAARRYALTYLHRGLYGTAADSHLTGAGFARLDNAIFKYPVNASLVGKPLYLKFTSFNGFGRKEQSLELVNAYSYTVVGGLPSGPANLALQSPFEGLYFTVQWSPAAGAVSYDVEIRNAGVLRRSFNTTATSFIYTLDDATADGGPWRDFTIKVATESVGQTSAFSQINISNTTPAAPTGIMTSSDASSITIDWTAVADVDLQDYQVWISTTNGFTPGPGTLAYTGTSPGTTITSLAGSTTYYLRVAARDRWGAATLTYSAQITKATT